MILVTGATGNVGVELVKRLSECGEPIRAFVRSRTQSQSIASLGIELIEGDFTRAQTFVPALAGVDRLFLLIPSSSEVERQQRNFVDAARGSRIRHIVKLSQLGADENAAGRFQRYHGAVEKYILNSGIPYTFLRPNLFMQGLYNFSATISAQGVFYASAGNAKVSIVDVRDIASVAAKVLTEPGHESKTYDITGPEALTHADMADQLSKAIGKTVKYIDIPPGDMREALVGFGMPAWQADGVTEDYDHYRRGEATVVAQTMSDITGREATSFFQFAKDYAGRFLGKVAGVA